MTTPNDPGPDERRDGAADASGDPWARPPADDGGSTPSWDAPPSGGGSPSWGTPAGQPGGQPSWGLGPGDEPLFPPAPYGTPAPSSAPPPPVRLASVLLFVFAGLGALAGALLALFGANIESLVQQALEQGNDFQGMDPQDLIDSGPVFVTGGLLMLVSAALALVSGLKVRRRVGWARVLGIVLATGWTIWWAFSAINSFGAPGIGGFLTLALAAASFYTLWTLAFDQTTKRWFAGDTGAPPTAY